MTVTGYGHYRVKVKIDGKDQAIGNDYSRDLTMDEFMRRYVVAEDPSGEISTLPKNVQDAIKLGQIRRGMTRQQVFMAVGFPVSSENHDPNAKVLRFWISSFSEFRVVFDDSGTVIDVEGDRDAKSRVFPD